MDTVKRKNWFKRLFILDYDVQLAPLLESIDPILENIQIQQIEIDDAHLKIDGLSEAIKVVVKQVESVDEKLNLIKTFDYQGKTLYAQADLDMNASGNSDIAVSIDNVNKAAYLRFGSSEAVDTVDAVWFISKTGNKVKNDFGDELSPNAPRLTVQEFLRMTQEKQGDVPLENLVPPHDHPYAKDDHTHDTSHSHGNYFLKGGGTDDDGDPLPLPYGDAFTLGEAVDEVKDENSEQNDRLDAVEAHGHSDLATKEDVAALEAEMELLAKTLESGVWQVTDSSIRPGKVNLTSNAFTAVDNILNIHNEDSNGKTHGWAALDAGSYIELTQGSSSADRSLDDADYALYEVTSVMKTSDWVSITVKLYQGHGNAVNDEFFRIKVIDLAGTDINDLDSRYAKTNHTHNYAASNHTHSDSGNWPDRNWDQVTRQVYAGDVIKRYTGSHTFPYNAADWTAQKADGNHALGSASCNQVYQLGIYPPWGTGGFEGGYTGLIMFGESRYSETPIAVFQVIKLERSTDYFRWWVRCVWMNGQVTVANLEGKSFIAAQGAVFRR